MATSSTGQILEDEDITFTCVTDESSSGATVVWQVDGKTISSSQQAFEEGRFNANITRSDLSFTVNRTLNQKSVECFVEEDNAVIDATVLDLTCEQFKAISCH